MNWITDGGWLMTQRSNNQELRSLRVPELSAIRYPLSASV